MAVVAWRAGLQVFSMLMFLASASRDVSSQPTVLDVKNYGAIADGNTDNSQAFMEAWKEACSNKGRTVVNVNRGGKYYVRQVSFMGPCNGKINFMIWGDIYAPTDEASHKLDYWIKFGYVSQLVLSGNGKLYGGGSSVWHHKPNIQVVPQSLRLEYVNKSLVFGIHSIDSKGKHISIFECNDLVVKHIRTTAPADSPNTDGLHIAESRRIQVIDSTFDTGDDCVAIFSGSNEVNVSHSICGPGHGISIGSMGERPSEAPITNINILNCTVKNSDNGFRIKTWAVNSYPTYANEITAQGVQMVNVRNPIIIDQYYCPRLGGCGYGESEVQIENVKLKDIWGYSSTEVAVELHCSKQKPCRGIELENINLVYRNPEGGELGNTVSSCSYVNGVARGLQVPEPCI